MQKLKLAFQKRSQPLYLSFSPTAELKDQLTFWILGYPENQF